MENRHVECLLSLIVIMYGLTVIIPNAEAVILHLSRLERASYIFIWLNLTTVVAGCLWIVFFPRIVQWTGYFATAGKPRSRRRWFSKEILAIPLILFALTEFLYVFLQVAALLSITLTDLFISDTEFLSLFYGTGISWFLIVLFYLGFAAMVLFNARRIAAWLLR